jgi:hypothetical protein
MGETARNLGRHARHIRSRGGRSSRIGLVLIIVGALLLAAAIVGAIAVNL